jgi:hypothetical protein
MPKHRTVAVNESDRTWKEAVMAKVMYVLSQDCRTATEENHKRPLRIGGVPTRFKT